MQKIQQRQNRPVHTVVQYNYTMESSRKHILTTIREQRTMSFEKLFDICNDRLHAIFLFLSMLEMVQLNYMSILVGEGRNNFIVEYNPDRPEDPLEDAVLLGEEPGPEPDDDGPSNGNGNGLGGLFPGFLDASAN